MTVSAIKDLELCRDLCKIANELTRMMVQGGFPLGGWDMHPLSTATHHAQYAAHSACQTLIGMNTFGTGLDELIEDLDEMIEMSEIAK